VRSLSVQSPLGRLVKGGLDLGLAVAGLVVLAPLLLLVGIVVRLDSPGPALFAQERIGRGGRPFRMWKYRTMVHGAERLGPGITVAEDQRVTRVGRWLRQTKLDELPQLLNVLLGDMSLVGPRPELGHYVALYSPEERAVLALRPGITDPATLAFRHEEELLAHAEDPERHYRDVVMPEKLALNLEYARRATVLTDLAVLVRTVAALFERPVPPLSSDPADPQRSRHGPD